MPWACNRSRRACASLLLSADLDSARGYSFPPPASGELQHRSGSLLFVALARMREARHLPSVTAMICLKRIVVCMDGYGWEIPAWMPSFKGALKHTWSSSSCSFVGT